MLQESIFKVLIGTFNVSNKNGKIYSILLLIVILLLIYSTLKFGKQYQNKQSYKNSDAPNQLIQMCMANPNSSLIGIMEDYRKKIDHNNSEIFKGKNLYMPCQYDDIDKEISSLPNDENGIYFIIDSADQIAAKNLLWKNLVDYHGLSNAKMLSPETYALYDDKDKKRLEQNHYDGKIYILKKNIQRQHGLKITDSLQEILNNNDNYIIAQDLLQNPYLLNGYKINLRVYMLVICDKDKMHYFIYNDGFMYYTPKKFIKGTKEFDYNVTTGYVDRHIYEINPLTIQDFIKYLDSDRELTEPESDIRENNLSVSNVLFTRILDLMRNIVVSFKGKICKSTCKIYNNVTYQVFGVDVAIDDKLYPQIMEINKGPDLTFKDERDGNVKKKMFLDIHKLLGILPNDNNGFMKIHCG